VPDRKMQMQDIPPVYVVSGSAGSSGEQMVNTVLAQFQDSGVQVITVGNVRTLSQMEIVIDQAKATGGTIVHTMVDARVRAALKESAKAKGVVEIDLVGPLMSRLKDVLGKEPAGQPGLYRLLHKSYFDRVSAIEFTMEHDDGQGAEGWSKAEIMLLGLSRSGKTPLSIYLSVLGYKVANYPVIPGVPMPEEFKEVAKDKVVGLMMDADRLLAIRSHRISQIGAAHSSYNEPSAIEAEIDFIEKLYKKGGFYVINTTNRTIESSADEIIKRISKAS